MSTPEAKKLIAKLKTKPETYWIKRGEKMALRLFKEMSQRVPAYKDFLKKNKIDPKKIKTVKDFHKVPAISKDTYLKKYPLKDLCWDGKFAKSPWIISATSGSTGEPFYFPRTSKQDKQYALLAELYLLTNFQIDKKTTLYINGFAMGVWIGGLFTYQAIKSIAENGKYPLSIINPGLNTQEILKAINKLSPEFDQVIIGGYPPFVKDILDEGKTQGFNWKKINLGFVFSAEPFSENFRDYILNIVSNKNQYLTTLNHYGTVDQGTLAYETPLSILIRKLKKKNQLLNKSLFNKHTTTPTLAQYLPEQFYFEQELERLICSSFSGLPLFRYDLKDNGGVVNFGEMENLLKINGQNLQTEYKKAHISKTVWKLPFVYVYERNDMVLSWYGANIYPEQIRETLLNSQIAKNITGKFSTQLSYNKSHNPLLNINLELKRNINPKKTFSKTILAEIIKTLLEKNSEFKNNYSVSPKKNTPKIILWPNQSKPFFNGQGKQKWVIK